MRSYAVLCNISGRVARFLLKWLNSKIYRLTLRRLLAPVAVCYVAWHMKPNLGQIEQLKRAKLPPEKKFYLMKKI